MTAADERLWRGVFLVFEGGDGVGKTTQVARMCGLLAERGTTSSGRTSPATPRPAGGSVTSCSVPRPATSLRAPKRCSTQTRLSTSPRWSGRRWSEGVVVCDRYVDSMLAYQGAGRMLELSEVESITRWATDDVRADLTVVLDMDPALAVGEKRQQDRVEAAGDGFHARARSFFLDLAARDADRYLVLDARLSRAEITDRILERLQPMLATTPVEPTEPRAGSVWGGWHSVFVTRTQVIADRWTDRCRLGRPQAWYRRSPSRGSGPSWSARKWPSKPCGAR